MGGRKITHAGDGHGVAVGQVTQIGVDRRAVARPGLLARSATRRGSSTIAGCKSMTAASADVGAVRNTSQLTGVLVRKRGRNSWRLALAQISS